MATALATGVASWPSQSQSVTPGRALFAKGLAKGCTSAHLQALFSQVGTVTDCQIARHRSGRSAGFAIVTFLRHEEAVAAMQTFDNYMYMGRRLSVKWFSPERAIDGSSHGVDALNMQALQHALQLTQLQPADLMAQLAQMFESPRVPPQQPQNPHVAAWLDNFILAQQRDSPLAPPIHEAPQPQPSLDLLTLSALSLADIPGAAALGLPTAASFTTNPNTPSACPLDLPDGAVFVTTTAMPTSGKGAASANLMSVGGAGANMGHSRLAKWCTGTGSNGGQSSAAQSLADDASSASETASVHASDDSSVATTVQIATVTCDPPSCSPEGTSPSLLPVLSTQVSGGGMVAPHAGPGTPTASGPVVLPAAGNTATGSPVASPAPLSPPRHPAMATTTAAVSSPSGSTLGLQESEELRRSRVLAAVAASNVIPSRPGVVGSDPGAGHPGMLAQRPSFSSSAQTILPGAPPLAPLRTVPSAPQPATHQHHHHGHHHHHHAHGSRSGTQSARQSSSMIPTSYNSCGGVVGSAPPPSDNSGNGSGNNSSLQQALRLQQALQEARTISAQQQYVDALAKLAAARDQVMAAASLLSSTSTNGPLPSLPPALASTAAVPHHHGGHPGHHHHHPAAAALMGHPAIAAAGPMNPYMAGPPGQAPGGVPDLSTLLMLQNAAALNRPLY